MGLLPVGLNGKKLVQLDTMIAQFLCSQEDSGTLWTRGSMKSILGTVCHNQSFEFHGTSLPTKNKKEFHGIFIFVFPLKSKIAPSNQGLSMAIISQISCQLSFLQFSFIWAPSVFWSDHGRSTRSVHGPKVGPVKSCPRSACFIHAWKFGLGQPIWAVPADQVTQFDADQAI